MSTGPGKPGRLVRLLSRTASQIREDLDAEIAFHCDMRVAELMARGVSEPNARAQVALETGDLADARRYVCLTDAATERAHDRRITMHHVVQELRHAVRRLIREPAFTLTALSTLGLGLSASILMSNVVGAVLLSPLPFHQPDRVVMIWQYIPSLGPGDALEPIGGRQLVTIRQNVAAFASVDGFRARPVNLGADADAERVDGVETTGGFFATLGVTPELGQWFTTADESASGTRSVVISDALWRRRFGADRHVIGQAVSLNDQPYVIGAVAPPGFAFPRGAEMPPTFQFPARTDVWIPIAPPTRGPEDLAVMGRLRPQATLAQARQQLDHVTEMMVAIYPQAKGFFGTMTVPLREQLVGESQRLLLSLLAAVALLLLIACVNTAQLQLARLQRQRRDAAIRAALGAPAWRLRLGSALEVLAIAVLAGAIGTVIAWGGFRLLTRQLADKFPLLSSASFSVWSVGVAVATAVLVGLGAGLLPSLFDSSLRLVEALRRGGRGLGGSAGAERLRRGLVVAEVSTAVVLVAMAGLMVKSLSKQLGAELGFKTPDGFTFELTLPSSRYPERQGPTYMEHPAGVQFIASMLDRLRAMPGVETAAMGKPLPLSGSQEFTVFSAEDHPRPAGAPMPGADYTVASGDMFRALGSPILAGRDFNGADQENSQPVVIVNRSMVRWLWPGESPIGKRIKLGGPSSKAPWMTVIGEVGDLKRYALTDTTRPEMIVPFTQKPYPTFNTLQFVVRSSLPAGRLVPEIQSAVAAVDPMIPVSRVRSIDELIAYSSTSARFAARFMTAFGASALFLAMIGLYGVIAYAVGRRRQEFGVRRALGASEGQILSLVAREAATLTLAGAALGIAVALAAGFAIRGLLYGVVAYDPLTLTGSVAILVAAGALAAVAPAMRAARIEPRTALEES